MQVTSIYIVHWLSVVPVLMVISLVLLYGYIDAKGPRTAGMHFSSLIVKDLVLSSNLTLNGPSSCMILKCSCNYN